MMRPTAFPVVKDHVIIRARIVRLVGCGVERRTACEGTPAAARNSSPRRQPPPRACSHTPGKRNSSSSDVISRCSKRMRRPGRKTLARSRSGCPVTPTPGPAGLVCVIAKAKTRALTGDLRARSNPKVLLTALYRYDLLSTLVVSRANLSHRSTRRRAGRLAPICPARACSTPLLSLHAGLARMPRREPCPNSAPRRGRCRRAVTADQERMMKSSTSALRRSTISMLAFLAATALWAVPCRPRWPAP